MSHLTPILWIINLNLFFNTQHKHCLLQDTLSNKWTEAHSYGVLQHSVAVAQNLFTLHWNYLFPCLFLLCSPQTIKQPVIWPAKQGLFRSSKELQFWTGSYGEPCELQVKQEREEGDVGRGCYKQKAHWRKLGVQNIAVFHWLSCCQAGKKKSLFLLSSHVASCQRC